MQKDHLSGGFPFLPLPFEFDLLKIFESLREHHQSEKNKCQCAARFENQNRLALLQSQLRKRCNPFLDSDQNPSKALKSNGSEKSNQTIIPDYSHCNCPKVQNSKLPKTMTSSTQIISLDDDDEEEEERNCNILPHSTETLPLSKTMMTSSTKLIDLEDDCIILPPRINTSKLSKTIAPSAKIINLEDDEEEEDLEQHQRNISEPLVIKDNVIEQMSNYPPNSHQVPAWYLVEERRRLLQQNAHLQNQIQVTKKKSSKFLHKEVKCVLHIEDEDPQKKSLADNISETKSETSEVTETEGPSIGPGYQATIGPLELNQAARKRLVNKRPLKLVWNPEDIEEETVTNFIYDVQKVIRKGAVNEGQVLQIFKEFNWNSEVALAIIKRNRINYKNLLG